MNFLFAAVRSVHYASTLLLFGELVFLLVVVAPARAADGSAATDAFVRRFIGPALSSLIVSIASGLAWFAVAASVMSGLAFSDALDRSTLSQVLAQTELGGCWMLRFGRAIGLGSLLVAFSSASRQGARSGIALGMLAMAAVY